MRHDENILAREFFTIGRDSSSADNPEVPVFLGEMGISHVIRHDPQSPQGRVADTVRNLQRHMTPNAEHILDWFHVTMRVTVMENLIAGLQKGRMRRNTSTMSADLLESVKWNVWHGKVDRSLERAEELRKKLAKASAVSRENARKLRGKLGKFIGYIDANRAFISNYEKRYHAGKPISTSFVDQVVSRRFVKNRRCVGPSAAATTSSSFARVSSTTSFDRVMQGWYPGLQIAA
jgi:hypothetical protein